jgi:hypothetical protein
MVDNSSHSTPFPPAALLVDLSIGPSVLAFEWEWGRSHFHRSIIASPTPEHSHLLHADTRFLWTVVSNGGKGAPMRTLHPARWHGSLSILTRRFL